MTQDERLIDLPLRDAVRDAYAADGSCPAPDVFLDAVEGRLPESRLAEVATHAQTCPACSAELQLAREFVEAAPDADPEDLEYVTARLDSVRPWGPTPVTAARSLQRWRIPLALAASVMVAVGALRLVDVAPELPTVPDNDIMRGAYVDAVAPQGDITDLPDTLEWLTIESADHYQVTLRTVDDTVLWQAEFHQPPATVPHDIRQKLHQAVTYNWEVTARDAADRPLARSTPMIFRILPDATQR